MSAHITTAKVLLVTAGSAIASGLVAAQEVDHTITLALIASVPPTLTAIFGFVILFIQNRNTAKAVDGKLRELVDAKESIAIATGFTAGAAHEEAKGDARAEKVLEARDKK